MERCCTQALTEAAPPVVDRATTTVAVLDVDLRLLLAEPIVPHAEQASPTLASTRNRDRIAAHHRQVQEGLDRLRFALLLASDDDNQLITATQRGHILLNPLAGGGRTWTYPDSDPKPSGPLTAQAARATAIWYTRLLDHPPDLWLGARRLLSATTARNSVIDAFVDAVVCWENLFGSGQGDVTFRVCGSLATLLHSGDPHARRELFSEARRLYQARNSVVHGGVEPSPDKATANRDRAIQIAVRACRALHDRTDLLTAENSTARSHRVLLEF